jgi:pantetheine-phosphate adenylyltransferase
MSHQLPNRAVYAGSFDPITYGHIDLITRADRFFDELVIGVGENPRKNYLFSIEERVEMVIEQVKDFHNIRVQRFQNLLINFAHEVGAQIILRGLRAATDFDYEFQMGLVNRDMNNDIETFFLLADPKYIFISSSAVKEIALFDGDFSDYVPEDVAQRLRHKVIEVRKQYTLT